MKTHYYIAIVLGFASCVVGAEQRCNTAQIIFKFPKTPLNATEKASIEHMLAIEKLFQDVYTQLTQRWQQLDTIPQSEQRHTQAVEALLSRYQLANPYAQQPSGNFADETLAQLYREWSQQGQRSWVEALKVAALIEEKDIADLEQALANEQIDNFDVQFVYKQLAKASRNHLRKLVSTLKAQDVDYQPQYLSAERFQSIIAAQPERHLYEDVSELCQSQIDQQALQQQRLQQGEKWIEQHKLPASAL